MGAEDIPGTTFRIKWVDTNELHHPQPDLLVRAYTSICRLCGHQTPKKQTRERALYDGNHHMNTEHADHETVARRAIQDEYVENASRDAIESMLTGFIAGSLMEGRERENLNIADVRPIIDTQGNYSNMIRVEMGSGTTFIVHVTPTEEA